MNPFVSLLVACSHRKRGNRQTDTRNATLAVHAKGSGHSRHTYVRIYAMIEKRTHDYFAVLRNICTHADSNSEVRPTLIQGHVRVWEQDYSPQRFDNQ